MCFFSLLSSFYDEKMYKRITTSDNRNVQSHDQGKTKWTVQLTQTVVLIHLHMTK